MADKVLVHKVADAFVEQYYAILNKSPENLHRFYQESSSLGWSGLDGVMTPVTTLTDINAKIMSSDYKNGQTEAKTVDAQESLEGGVMVVVTGLLTDSNIVKKNFSHCFFLAKQEKGFFVLNDILRFFDISAPAIDSATKDDLAASSLQNSVPSHNTDSSAINSEVVAKTNVKESLNPNDCKDNDARATSITSNAKAHAVAVPASNVKDEPKKISYASMVAKMSPVSSPKTMGIPSKSANQVVSPSITKLSSPRSDFASKAPTPSTAVSGAAAPPGKIAPKLPSFGNGAAGAHAQAGGRGIYIGNLPTDITKQGVAEIVKQFGLVKRNPDSIQIRRHEDGFCCGFVEFESADAARRAVEVHHLKLGEKEAYITYKRSPYNRGNNGRGKSPSRGGFQNGNLRGRDNYEVSKEASSPAAPRGRRRGRMSNQWIDDEEEVGEVAGNSN